MTLKVGCVGLGTMGTPMARNLAKAGFELALATRTPGKAKILASELSATACDSAQELASLCDVVVSCLPDSPEVEEVHLGARGTVQGAKPGTVVVDCSTIAAEAARSVAQRLARSGIGWLDAPVSGGQKGARSKRR